MRKHRIALITLLLIADVVRSSGQTTTQIAAPTDVNAVVGVKALFRNGKGEILLVFDDRRQAWEVPGASHQGQSTTKDLMNALALDLGITYEGYRLGGLFTYHNPQRGITILRPYYMGRFQDYIDGKGFKDRQKTKWFSLSEAKKIILYPASILIVEKLVREPTRVWGGAFEEYGYTSPMTDRGAVKFRIIEDFYRLK
jgi:hypothetical protein